MYGIGQFRENLDFPKNLYASVVYNAGRNPHRNERWIALINTLTEKGEPSYFVTSEDVASVMYLIYRMNAKTRDMLLLYFKEQKPMEAVAKEVNRSKQAVWQNINNALYSLGRGVYLDILVNGVTDTDNARIKNARTIGFNEGYYAGLKDGKSSALDQLSAVLKGRIEKEGLDKISLNDVPLSIRSYNCLRRSNCETLGDVACLGSERLLKVRNLGRKSYDEIVGLFEHLGFDIYAYWNKLERDGNNG